MTTRILKNDTLIRELKNAIILQNLSARELKRFAKICEPRDYDAGEYLVAGRPGCVRGETLEKRQRDRKR